MVHLDYRDARPIYTQIVDNFKSQICAGILQSGEKLPSVRELAGQLAINPNTIQRAYETLEQEGYVYSVPGKGSFAAPRDGVDTQRRARLLEQWQALTRELLYLGVEAEDLRGRICDEGGNDRDPN